LSEALLVWLKYGDAVNRLRTKASFDPERLYCIYWMLLLQLLALRLLPVLLAGHATPAWGPAACPMCSAYFQLAS
jgi:hypothetical protein